MSDAYSNVVGGGLKLKGISKKKKKKKEEDAPPPAAAIAAAAAAASSSSAPPRSASDGHTPTERRRAETLMQRSMEKLERGEVKTHRERVQAFNSYLGSLTEHYDLPKVSKGN